MANNGGVYTWSKTAANNASFDSTINWAEGQAPSSVNDSARSMMASTAKWRDDIAGSILTTGSSTVYAVTSNQDFDTLADFAGQVIAFSPHITNGPGPVTLTVDGFANIPLRSSPNVELQAGTIIQGTPYLATYSFTDGALYLQGFYGNPYNVPLLSGMDFWDTVAPNSSFIFPQGQAISRTTYAKAFARWGTTYGVGDGSTTFNVPDKTGRVSAMIESAASRLSATYFGGNSTLLGAVGGSDHHLLTLGEIPSNITSGGTVTVTGAGGDVPVVPKSGFNLSNVDVNNGSTTIITAGIGTNSLGSTSLTGNPTLTSNNTGGNNHSIVPPLITCNYIIRIL